MELSDISKGFNSSGWKYGTLAVGFIAGTDSADAAFNGGWGAYLPMGGDLLWLKDFMSHMGISGVTLPGNSPTVNSFSFKPMNIFNTATAAVIGLEIADYFIDGKVFGTLKKFAEPFLIGYAAGKMFDPPSPGNPVNVGPLGYSGIVQGGATNGQATLAGLV